MSPHPCGAGYFIRQDDSGDGRNIQRRKRGVREKTNNYKFAMRSLQCVHGRAHILDCHTFKIKKKNFSRSKKSRYKHSGTEIALVPFGAQGSQDKNIHFLRDIERPKSLRFRHRYTYCSTILCCNAPLACSAYSQSSSLRISSPSLATSTWTPRPSSRQRISSAELQLLCHRLLML